MDLGLDGARALIGGGSGGLGGAIAAALRAEGAQVGLAARPSDRLDAAAARLEALAVPADLSTPDGPADAVAATVEAFGGLDLLVVNSGGPPPGRFTELDEAAWQAAIDGTLWSAIRILRAALPHLQEGRNPAILVLLSSSVREPIPGLTTSNAIRPGLVGLIKSLVDEIVPVRINGLAPGRLSTARIAQIDANRSASTGIPVEEIQKQVMARIPSAATATRWSSVAWPRSCSRRRPPTSPGRSCRSTEGGPGAAVAGLWPRLRSRRGRRQRYAGSRAIVQAARARMARPIPLTQTPGEWVKIWIGSLNWNAPSIASSMRRHAKASHPAAASKPNDNQRSRPTGRSPAA